MKFPFFQQPDSMDCGPTCLRMIAKFYGKNLSLQYLRDTTQISKMGVNLLGISQAAESIGFRTQALKLDFDSLANEALLPCIVHWNQYHFVVLYKATPKKLFVADPGSGLVTYTPAEFKQQWISSKNAAGTEQGIALLVEPTSQFEQINEDAETSEQPKAVFDIRSIFNYLLPHKKMLIQILMGLSISSILQAILPFLTQSIVDVGINNANLNFINIVLLAQLFLVIGRLSVDFIRSWLLLYISTRINISILTEFLIKLMKLPASFFDSKKTGDILQRMNDHQRIEYFLTGSSLTFFFSLSHLILFSIVLALFNINIFFVFTGATVLYATWVLLFLKRRKILDNKRFEVASREQSATIQLIQGMQEIKLNGVEKQMRWKWEGLQAKLFKLSQKGLALSQWQQSGASLINETKNIFITFLSARSVIDGHLTLGSMLAIQYVIGQLNSPIEQLVGFLQSWQNARISIGRLNEIHSLQDEEAAVDALVQPLNYSFTRQIAGGSNTPNYEPGLYEPAVYLDQVNISTDNPTGHFISGTPEISLSSLSFTYPGAGQEPVLKNINLTIPFGKTTAIVGVSGSGKTTLIKLLLKFYNPGSGEIRIDGTPLSAISHRLWRAHCGAVMQESFIFSDTIANNIAVGEEKIDMNRLRMAIDIANIGDFVFSLPLGFNTKIGSEGTGISMGQKQRILIARAVYKNPEFIFLDEATNSLDANNESAIVHKLESFLKGKTVITIAHRLSTVKNADQIVVLKKGVITEIGSHRELINLKGEYYALVKNQLELGD